tara:strand:+ start:333 stop:1568 length:1236 start_codon:yes stop_codon:yes gene_type:complete
MIRDRIKELRRVKACDLIPNPKNWRIHPPAQADVLRELIEQIGYAEALVARETPDGLMLIDGHLRAETTPDAEVPVLVLDITEDESDVLLATLDPIAAMAQADQDSLTELLDSLDAGGVATTAMLEALRNGNYEPLSPMPAIMVSLEEDESNAADAMEEAQADEYVPFTEPGQFWQLGEHRLMCADATGCPPGLEAEVLWTDPPYGVDYAGKTAKALTMQNDQDNVGDLLQGAFSAANEAMAPSARFYIAAPSGLHNLVFRLAVKAQPWRFHQGLIWVKDSMVLGHSDHHVRHEDILYGWKHGTGRPGRGKHKGARWYGNHSQTTVFEIPRPKRSQDHPTMKPVGLVERNLLNSSKLGDLILDPFVGSGTTIIAAEKLNRRCYAMEIDPRYCDVTIRRWEAFTGLKAELIE